MSGESRRTGPSVGAFKKFVQGRLEKSSITDPDEVPRGRGAIVQVGHKKIAVYKDEAGKIHMRSPVCTHMKCIVGWNAAEKTWDCPCHGSRYDAYGHAIEGPAKKSLEEVELEEG